jgi:hypothetical protein
MQRRSRCGRAKANKRQSRLWRKSTPGLLAHSAGGVDEIRCGGGDGDPPHSQGGLRLGLQESERLKAGSIPAVIVGSIPTRIVRG